VLDDGTHCDEARQLAEVKLADVRKKLKDLRRIESALAALVRDCCTKPGHRVVSVDRHLAEAVNSK
jgi:MerR family mercuric resistance operon transcriptional regulator